jgi:arylsulfatase A-like enzyme
MILLIFLLFFFVSFPAHASCLLNTKPNILLITVDSLRPDHLGAYGYPLPTSPHIDHIATEGTLFKNAISQGGWTSPALVSIFTSLYPSAHGVEAKPDQFPCMKNSLLLKWIQAGYQVPAYEKINEEHNYSHLGFQPHKQYAFDLTSLKDWIRENRLTPFFCWYHINKTPHLPYNPEKPLDTLFLPKGFSVTPSMARRLEPIRSKAINIKGRLELHRQDMIPIKALYDGEVRMADEVVHEIYTFLAEEGLLDNTILVITADHGDELMDHGFVGHASSNGDGTLYEEIIHVPLILRYTPILPAGRTIEEIVETIDLMPTLLEITGIPGNQWIQGKSLLDLIQRKEPQWKPYAFSENSPCGYQCKAGDPTSKIRFVSLRSNRWKLIARQGPGVTTFSFYDLEKDPGERENSINEHKDIAEMYSDLMLTWYYENRMLRKALLLDCLGEPK